MTEQAEALQSHARPTQRPLHHGDQEKDGPQDD